MRKLAVLFLLIQLFPLSGTGQNHNNSSPLEIAVIGLTHTHVHWILGRPDMKDIKIVAIVEPNRALAKRYSEQHGFSMDLVYNTMEDMFRAHKPQAVTAFGTIYDHLEVVEFFAPKGVHVMVEKPLAVSLEHAREMENLANKYDIHLLTNYETSWYPTNHKVSEMLKTGQLGDIRKILINDGHQGPKEIGVNKEFLEWLTDPKLNGGGALTDFGCYGANLSTWLMRGAKPISVMAITQTIKPDLYPNVDDEATIILEYPKAQAIIQASWNWPISRKDMAVYGKKGYAISTDREQIKYRLDEAQPEMSEQLSDRTYPLNDPFAFFAAVIRGEIKMNPYDLSSLENNMIVVEILEAAKLSAANHKKIKIKKK